jgi:hypothetical protein
MVSIRGWQRPEQIASNSGAGAAAVQLDLFCSACHSMEPIANTVLYGSPEISGHECALIEGPGSMAGTSYRAGEAGAQATAQSERTSPWLLANLFQAVSQASMMSVKLGNTRSGKVRSYEARSSKMMPMMTTPRLQPSG